MSPRDLASLVIRPTLAWMSDISGERFDAPEAEQLLLAIALQESSCMHRTQLIGPAHGFWQFDSSLTVKIVSEHKATQKTLRTFVGRLSYAFGDHAEIFEAIKDNDILACVFARELLYTDPKPLPTTTDAGSGWDYYYRNWRPGKPRPNDWADNWMDAKQVLTAPSMEVLPSIQVS